MAVELIYCADGNKRFAEIAIRHGFTYGAQPLKTTYFPIEFADLDPNNLPSRERYVTAIKEHRPKIASVMDWSRSDQLPEVLAWAEDIAPYTETIVIIPKVIGEVDRIPSHIGGKPVRLGYSVPTRHGGTEVPSWEFCDRPIHLLGGSPNEQYKLSHYLNVHSVDGNMHHLMATTHCQFFVNGTARYARNRFWPTLKEANGGIARYDDDDLIYEAFDMSCKNIMEMWNNE